MKQELRTRAVQALSSLDGNSASTLDIRILRHMFLGQSISHYENFSNPDLRNTFVMVLTNYASRSIVGTKWQLHVSKTLLDEKAGEDRDKQVTLSDMQALSFGALVRMVNKNFPIAYFCCCSFFFVKKEKNLGWKLFITFRGWTFILVVWRFGYWQLGALMIQYVLPGQPPPEKAMLVVLQDLQEVIVKIFV